MLLSAKDFIQPHFLDRCCYTVLHKLYLLLCLRSTVRTIIQNTISCPVSPHHSKHDLLRIERGGFMEKKKLQHVMCLKGEVLIYRATLLQSEQPVCWQRPGVSQCEFC